jgi:hypothetical protein
MKTYQGFSFLDTINNYIVSKYIYNIYEYLLFDVVYLLFDVVKLLFDIIKLPFDDTFYYLISLNYRLMTLFII